MQGRPFGRGHDVRDAEGDFWNFGGYDPRAD